MDHPILATINETRHQESFGKKGGGLHWLAKHHLPIPHTLVVTYFASEMLELESEAGFALLRDQLKDKIRAEFRLAEATEEAPFRFSHIKGRGNYGCLRRLHELAAAPQQLELWSETDAERDVLAAIIRWSAKTEDGSLSDLPFQPRGETWEKVEVR